MIDQKQIPPEAGSAAENEVAQMLYGNPFSELSGAKQDVCTNIARAAFLAMIEEWPGMEFAEGVYCGKPYNDIILPLPQENSDDQ